MVQDKNGNLGIDAIMDILLQQKRELELRSKERYVARDVSVKDFNSDLIKVIIGPRRAGKSFLAFQLAHAVGAFGYVNFDDERLVKISDYDIVIAAINNVYGNPKLVLFDEIQNIDGWELFVNRLQRQGLNLVLTGSNSNLLSRELATHLTGRHIQVSLLSFSFKEYIHSLNAQLTAAETKQNLSDYLLNGGYPEPIIKGLDRKAYAALLFDSTLYKDIIKRHKIRSVQSLEDLALFMVSNVAKGYSLNSLARATMCKSPKTVEKYLGYLEESFIFFSIRRFSFKLKDQLSNDKKAYVFDNGFVNAKGFKTSPDIGRLYENTVAIQLKRKEMEGGPAVYFWRNQQKEEVDFVIKQGTKVTQLIQVCYNLRDPDTKKREIRALLKAGKELDCNDLTIVTQEDEGEESIEWFGMNGTVRYVPLWKWLLHD